MSEAITVQTHERRLATGKKCGEDEQTRQRTEEQT
jgi:hypothetical protein